jgi:hypothetical protein
MVVYPGAKSGFDGPIPAMRQKGLRRGVQDLEYLRLIEKTGKKTRTDLVRLADQEIFGGKVDYPAVRRSLYVLLAGAPPPGAN